jgi:peptidoglycan hydrolase FlgJ
MTEAAMPLAGAPLGVRGAAEPSADIKRVAAEFESVFISEMLAPMFEGLETDGLGGGGMGEETFRPMLIERYAEAISRAGGIGIAASIVAELQRMQAAGGVDGADR